MASPMSGAEWKNLNAFVARLHAIIDGIPYIDLKGLYAFLDALENPIPVTVLDDLVPLAACLILYAGFKLKYNDIGYPEEGYDNGEKRMPWSIGDLYGGPGGSMRRDGCFGGRDLGL